jgi:hypothetical protein
MFGNHCWTSNWTHQKLDRAGMLALVESVIRIAHTLRCVEVAIL